MSEEHTSEQRAYPAPPGKPVYGANGRKIIYDKDGKPCRSCNSLLDFKSAMGPPKVPSTSSKIAASGTTGAAGAASIGALAASSNTINECPPDVEQLGRSSWTLLHSIAATYPDTPSTTQQNDLKQFIGLFSKLYPCWYCGEDFSKYLVEVEPVVKNRDDFGKWLCGAHNRVNKKLGKPEFNCDLWKQRWKDGWDDGRCD